MGVGRVLAHCRITADIIDEIAQLRAEFQEINARLGRLVAEARSEADGLDRLNASVREVIDYAGKALALAGVIVAFH